MTVGGGTARLPLVSTEGLDVQPDGEDVAAVEGEVEEAVAEVVCFVVDPQATRPARNTPRQIRGLAQLVAFPYYSSVYFMRPDSTTPHNIRYTSYTLAGGWDFTATSILLGLIMGKIMKFGWHGHARRGAVLARCMVLLGGMSGCYASHGLHHAGADASRDTSVDVRVDRRDVGLVDAAADAADAGRDARTDASRDAGNDAGRDAALDAACSGLPSEPPGVPCPGLMVLRPRIVPEPLFDPLGPIDGVYLFARSDLPPGPNYMARMGPSLSSLDTSRPLEGLPLSIDGHDFAAGPPEAAIVSSGLLLVTLGSALPDLKLAFYDAEGHLAAPMTDIGWAQRSSFEIEAGCGEALVLFDEASAGGGSDVTGIRLRVDGTITARAGPATIPDGDIGVRGFWRGDRWTIFAIPEGDPVASPFLVDLFLDGTLGPRREVAIPPYPTEVAYLLTPAPEGPWSILMQDISTADLSYARFDPDSGAITTPLTLVYHRRGVLDSPRLAAREAGDVDGYLLLELYETTDSRTVLLRVRADGSVLQANDIERSPFHPPLWTFRYLGDRYAFSLPTGMGVLECAH